MFRIWLFVLCGAALSAETVLIQIRVLEGEGAVTIAGAKATRPITVQVTDETGKPVSGAGVTFRLPEESPTGFFDTGLKSEIQITSDDGRASAWGIVWGDTAGPVKIRVTATKDVARAGTIVSQFVTAPTTAAVGVVAAKPVVHNEPVVAPRKKSNRWWVVGLAGGGAIAAGILAGRGGAAAASSSNPTLPPVPSISIGQPTITVGKP
ncbi:MAG: hypothetical protein JNN08_29265 [Bryobacterales bacterium]|nr:hypothetical protein [Bryobacterales bacterium]